MSASVPPPYGSVVPERFDVFLSYNSRDLVAVQRIAQRLTEAGLEPWLDRWSLTPGGEWQRELGLGLDASVACAVFVGPHDLGAWELQEIAVAIDRAARERGFRVFPVLLPGVDDPFDPNRLPHFLRARTWVDFRRGHDDRRALQDLINAVKGVPFGPDVPAVPNDAVVPYRGLRVFGEQDAQFFCGRDREVQRLLEKLKSSKFVAVLGPSGSGKSSLVRAGLVPALRAGALSNDEDWRVLVLRPGAAPLTALAAQLATLGTGQAMQATLDTLEQDPRTLHLAVELALADRPAGDRVLVVVDQLEEVFTLCRDESERRQLFSTLLYATSAPGGRAVVIVTMRADFYVRCAAYPELAQLITAEQMLVGPMDADGLRQAIEEPARRVGLKLEERLSETILSDVAAEPGALPLLEHALLELWQRRRSTLLTFEGYQQAGAVGGALAQRADKIFDELSPDQQQIARRALLRLTQPGEGTEDTRRRATRRELVPVEGDDSFDVVLGRLVDARLLTTGRDETGVEVIDVSHEALIRGWPRLRSWIDADRAGLLTHRRLTDAAREWETVDHEPAALHRGARLAAAREWATDHSDDLSQLERDFLVASAAAERRTRRQRVLAGGLAALTAIVAVLAVWALDQRSNTQAQSNAKQRQATSLALASSASTLLKSRLDVALSLALQANRMSPRVEARSSMLAALITARNQGLRAILHNDGSDVASVAFSPDRRTLASGGDDGSIRLWDMRTNKRLTVLHDTSFTAIEAVAFSPDGKTLAAGGYNGLQLWDVRTHQPLTPPLANLNTVNSVAFSPDGRTLAAAGDLGTVELWDARTHKRVAHTQTSTLYEHQSAAFSPDGRTLATGGATLDGGDVRLWDPRTLKPLAGARLKGAGDVKSVAFSPDGHTLASGGSDGIRLWNVATRKPRGAPLTDAYTYSVAFSPDGNTLASTVDHAITMWNVRTRRQRRRPLNGHSSTVTSVAFSPDGRSLASGSSDTTIRVWDGGSAPLPGGGSVAFSPKGRLLASSAGDGIRLWDARTHKLRTVIRTGLASDVASLAFSPSGRTLAGAGFYGVGLWSVRTHKALGSPLARRLSSGNSVAFSPDGRMLASARDDGVRLWDVRKHTQIGAPLTSERRSINHGVAFSPDGRTLVTAGELGGVLWDVRTHKPRVSQRRLQLTAQRLPFDDDAARFSRDWHTLASPTLDNDIELWDVRKHRNRGAPLPGHTDTVESVAFSPDGRVLASGSDDKTIRLWDVPANKPLGTALIGHTDFVTSVAFSPDGRTLASGSDDGTVRLWDKLLWRNFAELQTEVCKLVGSGLSTAEWAQYAGGVSYAQSCP
jgi:WD40 repeat protein/energy-coupling factor transporter ATP-binding protein EcfA2